MGRAAVCDCGTLWTFHLRIFFFFFFLGGGGGWGGGVGSWYRMNWLYLIENLDKPWNFYI